MALTKGDDYPIHQTSEPIAYSGTDRNFYDRYFFNGYGMEGDSFFALAFGVYPHLNIADASFCIVRDGVQTNLHASRWLEMERMDLAVGPIRIEILEPLRRLKIVVDAPEQGIKAEIVFEGRAFPVEEPRFIRRNGPRAFMDYTRLTQNGRYTGWMELDGKRESVDGFMGTRDRSWGVRPIGARDPQEVVPPVAPQFFWIWSPTNFEDGGFFFHSNDDAAGLPWNRRAVWAPNDATVEALEEIDHCAVEIEWKPGSRHAKRAVVSLGDRTVTFEPDYEFFMLGLGYGHPKWGHGTEHGKLAVEREDFTLSEVNVQLPQHLHVQALSRVTHRNADGVETVGRGVLEQLVLGPHAPSGFKQILDFAPLTLSDQLAAYLTRTGGRPTLVEGLSRISGGASRETYRFEAVTEGARTPLILRRDPPGSLIETDRRMEFLAIRSFTGKGVAAPEALALEIDGAELERPFFIMGQVLGGAAGSPFAADPFGVHAEAMGEQFFATLGRIASEPIEGLPIMEVAEPIAPEDCWRRELDYWAGVIDADEQHPQPIVRAAIRRLRRKPPPPPAKLCVVHGDYRMGNFLHDGAGKLIAVLDWEMAHLGDPLEDLGWAINPLWSREDDSRISGMLPLDESLQIWSEASGLEIDPESLKWWSLFASVKGQAIWTSSAQEWRDGGMIEPILAFSGWYTARRHDEILASQLLEWPL